jgi:HAD superfamily hydrolase (TIGR01549 family)
MIKAILFDFGGTLFDYLPSNYVLLASIARKYGKDISNSDPSLSKAFQNQEALALKVFKERNNFDINCLSEEDWLRLDQILLNSLGIYDPNALKDLINAFQRRLFKFQILPETIETLKTLKKMNFKLGIISNTSGEQKWISKRYEMLKEYNIAGCFDTIIFSGEHPFNKPDPKIFKIALNELKNISPNETVFVGDSYIFDILGAKKANLIPVLLDENKGRNHDCLIISKISEILDVINFFLS